jgi:hypothetical protein
MTSYLAVTGHWITREWYLRSELLSFSELEGSHSGENIGEELYNIMGNFGIQDKIHESAISQHGHDLTIYVTQTQNITSDNVTVNDKSM